MSYECSNCCKELEDEFLVVQENHVILALFNDVENCFCSQQCVNDFLMIDLSTYQMEIYHTMKRRLSDG